MCNKSSVLQMAGTSLIDRQTTSKNDGQFSKLAKNCPLNWLRKRMGGGGGRPKTRLDQTRPDQTRPDQTRPDQTKTKTETKPKPRSRLISCITIFFIILEKYQLNNF